MPPTFSTTLIWQQAELLMQPAFIRTIDNIRKALETSSWVGSYQEVKQWPSGTSQEMQQRVLQLQSTLETASDEQAAHIHEELDHLPKPYPAYLLCLQKGDRQIQVDLWQVCYQICFSNYPADPDPNLDIPVEIDSTLIDDDWEVNWMRLDEKAKDIIQAIFAGLPSQPD
jgi:hypothetical protein